MKYNFIKRALSLLIALAILVTGNVFFTSSAQTLDELQEEADRLNDEIRKNEELLNQIKGDISKQAEYVAIVNKQLSDMNQRVSVLNSKLAGVNSKISALNSEIAAVNDDIKATEEKITENEKKTEETYENFSQRMRAMYMSGDASLLSVLLSSEDFSVFLTRSELVKRIAKNDNELIAEMAQQLKELEKEKKTLDEKKQELQKKSEELLAQKADLDVVKSDLSSQQADISGKYNEANNILASLDKDSAAYKNAIAEAERKKEIIEDKILEMSNNNGSNPDDGESTVTSTLYLPVQDPSVYCSAKFGRYPSGGRHRGYDITCNSAQGKPVYAAESGTVTIAGWQGDLGNYVLIDHGGGVKTGYAHNSSIKVSVGQKVERGQQISNIGNTGLSFGPHVHFVLIKNGQYVDPEPYLPAIPYRP